MSRPSHNDIPRSTYWQRRERERQKRARPQIEQLASKVAFSGLDSTSADDGARSDDDGTLGDAAAEHRAKAGGLTPEQLIANSFKELDEPSCGCLSDDLARCTAQHRKQILDTISGKDDAVWPRRVLFLMGPEDVRGICRSLNGQPERNTRLSRTDWIAWPATLDADRLDLPISAPLMERFMRGDVPGIQTVEDPSVLRRLLARRCPILWNEASHQDLASTLASRGLSAPKPDRCLILADIPHTDVKPGAGIFEYTSPDLRHAAFSSRDPSIGAWEGLEPIDVLSIQVDALILIAGIQQQMKLFDL